MGLTWKKIKIVHIIDSLGSGGMENGIVNLVNNLNSDIFESTILCLSEGGPFENQIDKNKVDVEILNIGQGMKYSHLKQLREYFRSHTFSVVHTHNFATGFKGILAGLMAHTPALVHGEHGSIQGETKIRRKIISYIIAHLAHKILYVSEGLEKYCVTRLRYPKSKGKVIINGVDHLRFKPGIDTTLHKKIFGLGQKDFVIGCVGRYVPFKNHAYLINVFAKIHEKYPGSKLLLVGDGPLAGQLHELVADLQLNNSVILTGYRKDVDKLYNLFDVFVLPSHVGEGTSNVILEAMMSGVLILASRIQGNDRLIENNVNGFLFDQNNPEELSALLEKMINNTEKRHKIASTAREYAIQNFSLDGMIKNYEDLYLKITVGKRTHFRS